MEQEKTLISVIVPCYNVEQYLPKCVDSILSQTYTNLEIFLVDDGSPDNCGRICDEYAMKDNRIKVIHKKNGGLSDARNVAIDVAKGEYVTFVDSDDYVASDYVETLYKLIVENSSQMSITWHTTFYEGTEPECQNIYAGEVKVLGCEDALISMFYQKDFDNAAWAKMYHRSLFADGIRYPKGWLFEDLPTTYRLMMKCSRVAFSRKMTYFYLLRKTSIEGAAFKPLKYESCMNIINQLKTDRTKMPIEMQKALDCRMVSFLFHILLGIPKKETAMRCTLLNEIKQLRSVVMFDAKARKKARVACLLSLGGMPLVNLFSSFGLSRS